MPRRLTLSLALGAATVALLGPVAASGASGGAKVTLRNIKFSPKNLTVSTGTTVQFSWNDDGTTHNVTPTGKKRFKRISSRSKGAQSRTFNSAGTYRYECTLHPGMTGRITVH